MSIEIRPKGEAAAVGKAGTIIGLAQKRAKEWEIEKASMRSQLDFQHELRLRQIELEKMARAREWELEKMELASRIDFEADEKERLRRKQEFQAAIKQVDDVEWLSPEEREKYKFNAYLKFQGLPETDKILGNTEEERFGVTPWYLSPQWRNTPEGQAALVKASIIEQQRPPSASRQRTELEAAYELQGYTEQDLIDLGLNPENFPNIVNPEGASVERLTGYEVGQIVNKAGKQWVIVGFDEDGEPLVEGI